jgi:hypothetical protein
LTGKLTVVLDILGGYGWMYSDGPGGEPVYYFMLSLVGFVFLASPIVVNWLARLLKNWIAFTEDKS